MNYPILKSGIVAIALSLCTTAHAVIADPTPVTVTQPDGSKVTLTLHGDEFFSYTTTIKGYTVVKNVETGAWEYAKPSSQADGQYLVSTGEIARDDRTPATGIKGLKPAVSKQEQARQINARRNVTASKANRYDYSKFRGLIILVEYNDAPFTREDIHDVFDQMINKPGYDGYMSNHLIPSKIECTGSVRDYYYENSNGKFDPVFDVIGPVKINYSQYYARKSSTAQTLVTEALKAADELVDYKLYDTDSNRAVDMVYFIFSGGGSNFSGNDERLIWPHASTIMSLSLDGVSFGRYACSTELYGKPANKQLDGIGTICHEFSHVLGLPDFYDVDYETGGQAVHPQKWSVMASGSYLNQSKTPCGYSLYERYALGFVEPTLITEPGSYSIRPLGLTDKPEGYRINSAIPNEYFLLEARNKNRWDAYLPGEGMLAHRVDYTDPKIWDNNRINATSARPYYELLRATPKISSSKTITDSDGDPFPGSGNKTELNNSTSPALRSWTTTSTSLVLKDISRNAENGTVTFTVIADNSPTFIEDFSSMNLTTADTLAIEGRFTTWDLIKGAKIAAKEDNVHYLASVKGSYICSYPFDGTVETCAVSITNPTSQSAIFRLYYSTDNGASWIAVNTLEGNANPSVARGDTTTIHYSLGNVRGAMFKLSQMSGNTSIPCRVNKIEFGIKGDSLSSVDMPTIDLDNENENAIPEYYNMQGIRIDNPSASGIYIEKSGNKAKKIINRQ